MPNNPFRILLLGDEKVGKTSLIKSYVSKSFPHEVPAVSPVVVIPSELSESKTTVTIVDSLYRRDQEREDATEVEIRKTDVVLLVYDMSRLESLSRLGSFWLPWIARVTKVPVILVGNKADMRTAGVPTPEETLSGLIRDYPQCVFATECNVLTLANTDTVFYYAHYAVLYPTAPLYDPIKRELTPKFTRAMQLCFRRLDKDQDKCLSDRELNDLQTQVFNTRFKDNELESLKDLIKAENQDGVVGNGVTFGGFLVLQKLLIKKLNGNVCWSLLRHFGFNDELELELDFRLDLQPSQSVELSSDTCAFLTVLFESYSTDGRLTLAGLQDVFSTVEVPFWTDSESERQWSEIGLHVPVESDGSLVLSSWLAVWFLYCYIDYKVIYHYLVLLGLSLPKSNVFVLTKPKEIAKSNNKRKVFLCYIYGDEGVGKNSLLCSFLSRPSDIGDTHLDTVCALVEGDRRLGESYYLILQVRTSTTGAGACDVACLLHDGSSASVEYLKEEVIPSIPEMTPKLIVRTKEDEEDVSDYSFAIDLGLAEHTGVSLRKGKPDSLFKQLIDISLNPQKGLGRAAREQLKAEMHQREVSYGSWVLSVVAAMALIGVAVLIKKG